MKQKSKKLPTCTMCGRQTFRHCDSVACDLFVCRGCHCFGVPGTFRWVAMPPPTRR